MCRILRGPFFGIVRGFTTPTLLKHGGEHSQEICFSRTRSLAEIGTRIHFVVSEYSAAARELRLDGKVHGPERSVRSASTVCGFSLSIPVGPSRLFSRVLW